MHRKTNIAPEKRRLQVARLLFSTLLWDDAFLVAMTAMIDFDGMQGALLCNTPSCVLRVKESTRASSQSTIAVEHHLANHVRPH